MLRELDDVDLFVTKASSEVVRRYRQEFKLRPARRLFRDTTASAASVGLFYDGSYTLILALATPNTVAKCVVDISETLVTNVFAQAGKCRSQQSYSPAIPHPNLRLKRPRAWSRFAPTRLI